jgi:hypothetical protein
MSNVVIDVKSAKDAQKTSSEAKQRKPKDERKKVKKLESKVNAVVKEIASSKTGKPRKQASSGSRVSLRAKEIAMSIACPAAGFCPRYSSEYASSKTAVGNPYARINTSLSDNDGTQWPANTLFGAIFRSPLRFLVHNHKATAPCTYVGYGSTAGATTDVNVPSLSWSIGLPDSGELYPAELRYLQCVSSEQVHGPILACGTPDGTSGTPDRFFWFDKGQQVSCTLGTTNTVTGALTFSIQAWDTTGVTEVFKNTLNSGSSVTCNLLGPAAGGYNGDSGYYAIRFGVTAGAASPGGTLNISGFAMVIASGAMCMAHKCAPGFSQWFSSASGVRFSGASLMLSNTTAMNFRGGQIAAYQCPIGTHWFEYASSNSVITSCQGSGQVDADNGMYTWLSPADESDFFFVDEYEVQNGFLMDTFYALNEDKQFAVMQFFAVNTVNVDFNGYWTVNTCIEFLTSDVSREVDVSHDTDTDWREALSLIKKMPKYAENPTHWRDLLTSISNGAKSAINWGVKNSSTLIKGAEFLGSLAMLAL